MRVTRGFASVDLCGFTAFVETYEEEATLRLLTVLRDAVRGVAEAHGIRVTKWLGDGAMISGVQMEPLVRGVLALRDVIAETSPLALRAGIAEGAVIMFEGDDYVGPAVNVAARLTRLAAPNQVLATAGIAGRVGESLTARSRPPLLIDGSSRAIEVRELLSVVAPAPPLPRRTERAEPRVRAAVNRSIMRRCANLPSEA
jgi:adenylate cyclase